MPIAFETTHAGAKSQRAGERKVTMAKLSLQSSKIEFVGKAVLAHIPVEHSNGVRIILGGTDGPLVTIDQNGHVVVTPHGGPGPGEFRAAVNALRAVMKAAQIEG